MIAYFCGSASWGGLEMNQWHNARRMQQRGHPVVVLGIPDSELHLACIQDGIAFEAIRLHRKHYDFRAAAALRRIVRKQNITDLIIRDGRDMSVATIAKFTGFGRFRVHYFMEMQLGIVKKNLAQTLRFRQLDSWICPLEWLVREVKTNTFMPHNRIRHIPVGIDLQVFQPVLSVREARQLLQLPEGGFIIGLAGRIDPQKGQLVLLEALKLLADYPVPFTVALLGSPTLHEDDGYYRSLRRFIEEEDLTDRVYCLPFRKDHHLFYNAIDALVMASRAETCGMVTIEAMATGIPVIGSNAGGTPELLRQGAIGYLFESMNPVSLAAQITRFLEDPKRFSVTELQAATKEFDHNRVCDLVEELIFN